MANSPLRESDGVSIEFPLTVYLHNRCPAQEFAGGLDDCPSRPARIVVATGRTNCRLSPRAFVRERARALGISDPVVGLITGLDHDRIQVATYAEAET